LNTDQTTVQGIRNAAICQRIQNFYICKTVTSLYCTIGNKSTEQLIY